MPSKTDQHGTGAVKHPDYHKRQILGADELGVSPPDFTKSTGLPEPPDEDQGSSSSCTCQADGYYIYQLTGMELLREDKYSHVKLPGGGAYLNAPGEFHKQYGSLLRSEQFKEPSPETEDNMSRVVLALDAAGRTHAFSFDVINISPDINTIASVLEQYKGAIIGIDGNNAGWTNMEDPTYNGKADWGHALYVYDRVVRNGRDALKAKSSWCNTGVKDHFINSDYFANGGVFEALVYANFKEIDMPNQTKVVLGADGKTVYLATPIAMDFPNFEKQASVEGIVIPNPIPPASTL